MKPAEVIQKEFAECFEEDEVKFKPNAVKGNRALALAYVDARVIMERLDSVVGINGWRDEYLHLPGDQVECRLSVRFGAEWITKTDVGGESEQPDGGDRRKAAYSDALKRAAVKFGIGRYLYRLPQTWADFDPMKKVFVNKPTLPEWARCKKPAAGQPPTVGSSGGNGQDKKRPAPALPKDGNELASRLGDADRDMSKRGLSPEGELTTYVREAGVKAGFGADIKAWSGPAIELAVAAVREYKAQKGVK